MSIKKTFLIIAIFPFCINSNASAQRDTLQKYPFIYCYNCVETGYHDSALCTVKAETPYFESWVLNDTVFYHTIDEFAIHQYSSEVLHAIGIAFGYISYGSWDDNLNVNDTTYTHHPSPRHVVLSLYSSDMKNLTGDGIDIEDFTNNWWVWHVDTSYRIFSLPGRVNPTNVWYDSSELVLKYAFFNEPIDVSGDFYIGTSSINSITHIPLPASQIPLIYETHNPPYHFGNSNYRARFQDVWYDGTMDHKLPILFLIIEPECHSAENFRVATDSAGCVIVEWDTLKYQRQWVLRLQGPGGTHYDTVETNNFTYCGLDTNAYYELSAMTKCYRPGGHNLSSWSDPVGFRNGTIAITEIENPKMKIDIHPNPASRQVVISATLPMTHIEATDILGHRLFDRPASGLTSTLDVSSWPAGTYLLRITTPSGVATKKLLVK